MIARVHRSGNRSLGSVGTLASGALEVAEGLIVLLEVDGNMTASLFGGEVSAAQSRRLGQAYQRHLRYFASQPGEKACIQKID